VTSSTPGFDDVFYVEFRSVARTVFLICHDHDRAEDITQDAFVELLRRWERVSNYERPGAWVRRVAIQLAIRSHRRDRRRWRAEQAVDVPAQPPLTDVDIDLVRAVRELPAQQRAAVVLFYFEDLPIGEIADLLGCSPATTRVHLHRARVRLGRLLAEQEVES
jgi:RNA polymerase sigma factor (sigma-70 family)